jgi:hypothetical protein
VSATTRRWRPPAAWRTGWSRWYCAGGDWAGEAIRVATGAGARATWPRAGALPRVGELVRGPTSPELPEAAGLMADDLVHLARRLGA